MNRNIPSSVSDGIANYRRLAANVSVDLHQKICRSRSGACPRWSVPALRATQGQSVLPKPWRSALAGDRVSGQRLMITRRNLLCSLLLSMGSGTNNVSAWAQTAPSKGAPARIVILGDSITAGYGLTRDQAFPAILQRKISQANLPFEVVAAGVSGDTAIWL